MFFSFLFCSSIIFYIFALGLYSQTAVVNVRRVLCEITESAAYAVLSVVMSTMTYLYKSGLWVGMQSRHRRRLSTLCLRHTEIFQKQSVSKSRIWSTVDVPGVIISIPVETCRYGLYPVGCNQMYYTGLFTAMIFISAWALTLSVRL